MRTTALVVALLVVSAFAAVAAPAVHAKPDLPPDVGGGCSQAHWHDGDLSQGDPGHYHWHWCY